MILPLIVLAPFLGALLAPLAARRGRLGAAWVASIFTLVCLAMLATIAPRVFSGETLIASWAWMPAFGLNISFRLDGLGLLFSILILGIGFLVILYARYYLSQKDCMGRFFAYLLLFMGAMLGIVLSENLILMLIFWELTSLSSFLLVSYWGHRADARQGARMALAVTGAGGLALLGGIILLGEIVGSYELSVVLQSGDIIKAHPLYVPALLLILLGIFTKSAQFPFHFWLPHAMAAPTPVSAYLHSATMVKAGVFLLARLFPALAGTEIWFFLVSGAGLITMVFAAYSALFKHDLKGLLAYSTISHLGLITVLFGFGTSTAAVAGVFHIINHAIFKASLFMAAGIIDHEAGTRDMRKLNGLYKYMPHTAILAMVAAASMAGVPLLNGFLSKEMFFAETLEQHWLGEWDWIMPAAATLAGVFAVAYSLRFIHDVFFNGEPVDLPRTPHEPPRWMKIPVEILVALCLLVGVLPAFTVAPILAIAAGAVLQGPLPEYSLSVWHGLNFALLMSVMALAGGILFYSVRNHLFRLHDYLLPVTVSGKNVFDLLITAIVASARWVTATLQNGSLQRYLAFFVGTAVTLGIIGAFQSASHGPGQQASTIPADGVIILATLALAMAAIGTVVFHRRRLAALVLLGVAGLFVSLTFVHFSAPDLALTQLSVEVVTIVLLLLALHFLPQEAPIESSLSKRWRDGILAAVAGLGVAGISWLILTSPFETLSGYYLENSVPGGGGKNVVNVILVDFRGFDTFGEITVLAIAAFGIHAMLQQLRINPNAPGVYGWSPSAHPLFLATISRPLLPLALLVSLYLLLRGHNAPGGGFIAGLVTGIALILQYLANGQSWAKPRLPINYTTTIAVGLGLAGLTGLASWIFGYPFLTSTFSYMNWPVVGKFELASAMIFDLGVFLVVVGITMLILADLGKLSGPATPATSKGGQH